MSRVVRVVSVGLNPSAACEDCPGQWIDADARVLAKDHTRQTGHTVVVETVTQDLYRWED